MLLKVGSNGNKVKELQKLLSLTTDGVFGIDTLKAVKNFQSKNGLISDGVVGSKTWDVLLNTPKIDTQDKQKYSLSDNGMKLLEQFEGLRLEAYLDSANIYTIGYGTCLEENTEIRMADGSVKKAKNIYVGEYIAGTDGKPKKVLARQDGMCRLISVKGYDYEYKVTPDHSIVFNERLPSYNLRNNKNFYNKTGKYFTKEAKYFLDSNPRLLAWEARCSFETGYKPVVLDPYILGTWLGDGIKNPTPTLCQVNNEVLDYWKLTYKNNNITTVKSGRETFCKHKNTTIVSKQDYFIFRAKGSTKGFHAYNLLHKMDSRDGSYKFRAEKHIPKDFLENCEDVRLQVLAGLVDTDGCVIKRKDRKSDVGHIVFDMSIVNSVLIKDTISLSQSLGFSVKTYNYVRDGYPNPFVTINISGDLTKIPLKVKYKRDNLVDKQKPNRIQSVSECGIGNWVGHTVEDSLIVLDSGIITHNTKYPNGTKVKLGDKTTKSQAKAYKLHDLKEFENTVNTSVKVPLTQNQYDALVSLSYNIGSSAFKNSTLLKKLNSGDYKGAAEQFLVWNKVNSKKVQGLVNRREAERNLFIK